MQTCPHHNDLREELMSELTSNVICNTTWETIDASDVLKTLLGGTPGNQDFLEMIPIWCIVSKWIHIMHERTVKNREGIG